MAERPSSRAQENQPAALQQERERPAAPTLTIIIDQSSTVYDYRNYRNYRNSRNRTSTVTTISNNPTQVSNTNLNGNRWRSRTDHTAYAQDPRASATASDGPPRSAFSEGPSTAPEWQSGVMAAPSPPIVNANQVRSLSPPPERRPDTFPIAFESTTGSTGHDHEPSTSLDIIETDTDRPEPPTNGRVARLLRFLRWFVPWFTKLKWVRQFALGRKRSA